MKKILAALFGIGILGIITIVVLVNVIDPNQFKGMISEKVKETTSQELVINGDISWRFFPSLGFTIGDTALKNPAGFSEENLIKFSQAELNISVMPLLSNKLEIGTLQLNGARFFIQTLKNGSSNLDALSQNEPDTTSTTNSTPPQAEPVKADDGKEWFISLAGIKLQNGSALIIDDKAKSKKEITNLNLSLDQFELGKASQLLFEIVGSSDDLKFDLNGKGDINVSKDLNTFSLNNFDLTTNLAGSSIPGGKIKLVTNSDMGYTLSSATAAISKFSLNIEETSITGKAKYVASSIPKITFEATSENIDLDKILVSESASTESSSKTITTKATTSTTKSAKNLSNIEPDLSIIKSMDLDGKLNIGQLKASNVITTNIDLQVKIKKGIAKLTNFSADLYEGKIQASATINANKKPATYSVNKNISGIQIRPLLLAAADSGIVSGTTNAQIKVNGVGLSDLRVRKNIKGSVAAQITDGAIHGVNLAQMLREVETLLKTDATDEEVEAADSEQKTDFASLNLKFNLGSGLATAKQISMVSPFISTTGSGNSNLVTEALNLALQLKIGEVYEDRGDLEFLKGQNIPLKITGTWSKPSYGIDAENLIKNAVQDKVKESVEKEVGNALKKLFQ